jgi:2'-5' RNA ligase
MTQFTVTNVTKGVNLLTSNDPDVWSGLGAMSTRERDVYYSRVAAAFRAFNLKANTVGNMPFCLVKQSQMDPTGKPKSTGIKAIDDTEEGEYFDESATWQNKVGFLPNPSELFRLNTLSYMASNTIYNLRTSDVLGYKTKGLRHAIADNFKPRTNATNTQLDYIERVVGTITERYAPDGKPITPGVKSQLVYMWRLDHTTELLPSPNTEMLAIMEAAGVLYYKSFWVENFYRRGGIKPTLISIKGLVDKESREEKERSWSNFLKGVGSKWSNNIARIINGENMSATTIGDGIGDMKDNKIHEEALADIAMGTGMPLSLLMANSANYATAKEEKATWYENDIIPLCNWLAYEYNRQVFEPLGLRLEFHPETLDPQQEDETERAQAMMQYASVIEKVQTAELFFGLAAMMGLEVPEDLHAAIEAFYEDKAEKEEEMREQMSQGGYTVGPDGKPIPAAPPEDGEKPKPGKPMMEDDDAEDEEEEEKKPAPFAKKNTVKASDYSAMIALRIPDVIRAEIKDRYPFVDSETLNELHITLVYLGDTRTLDKVGVIQALSSFAGYQSPIKGRLQGLARFINGQDVDPLVVTFDSPQMPHVYSGITSTLDSCHIPYHKDHGFIPHMTLAYIPSDSEMPIETIEPIEINFSEIYLVTGNEWLTISLTGYENKTAKTWTPSLDELEEMRVYREVALRKHKKGESLDFVYEPHHGGLPAEYAEQVKAKLLTATTAEEVKAAFVVAETVTPAPVYVSDSTSDILVLAAAINKLAEKA